VDPHHLDGAEQTVPDQPREHVEDRVDEET
jgi:hypothetical protein